MALEPKPDVQTVTPDGKRVAPLIDGVKVRYAITQVDERGTLCEILNPAWGFDDAPLVYIYEFTIAPKRIKGWVVHYEQEDRIFLRQGRVKIVLYDDRPQSSTYRMVNALCFGDQNRVLISYPSHVYHAFQNIGDSEAVLINMPTRAYNHAKPDKHRLALDTDKIPYRFDAKNINGQ